MALKTEESCQESGMQVASRSWKREGDRFSPRVLGKRCGPTDTLVLA